MSVEAMWKGEPQHEPAAELGVDVDADEDFLDDLLDDVVDFGRATPAPISTPSSHYAAVAGGLLADTEQKLDTAADNALTEPTAGATHSDPPYPTANLARICVHLNEMNRRAKAASMDCQKLFLTLYFKVRPSRVIGFVWLRCVHAPDVCTGSCCRRVGCYLRGERQRFPCVRTQV